MNVPFPRRKNLIPVSQDEIESHPTHPSTLIAEISQRHSSCSSLNALNTPTMVRSDNPTNRRTEGSQASSHETELGRLTHVISRHPRPLPAVITVFAVGPHTPRPLNNRHSASSSLEGAHGGDIMATSYHLRCLRPPAGRLLPQACRQSSSWLQE